MLQLDLLSNTTKEKTTETAEIAYIPIASICPHPNNPRLIMRDDVIDSIADHLNQSGKFEPRHAVSVRVVEDSYQLISGHHRVEACKKVGFEYIPAWVVDISDEEAFYELVRSNAQGELTPLEIGIHALTAVPLSQGGRGKSGGLSGYAKAIGKTKGYLSQVSAAAKVFTQVNGFDDSYLLDKTNLLDKAKHLSTIYQAPESEWQYLTEQLIKQSWSVKKTESVVKAINEVAKTQYPDWAVQIVKPDDWKQKAMQEALNDEANPRVPRDYKNLVEELVFSYDNLKPDRKVWVFEEGEPKYTTFDQRAVFITKANDIKPPLNKKKIDKAYADVLKECEKLDKDYERWLKNQENEAEKQKAKERRAILLNQFEENHAPIGINADIREANLPSEEFDAVITDPPYLLSNDGITVRSGKQVSVNKNFDDSKGSAIAPEDWLPIVFDALKKGGNLVVTCTDHLLFDLYEQGLKAGFEFRQKLAWVKKNSPPLLSADRFSYAIEDVLILTKPGGTPYFNYEYTKTAEDKQRPNYFIIPQCGGKERLGWHDTQKPLELADLLVNAYVPPQGNLLDPFAGTATFSVIAKRTGRLTTWVETNPEFFEKAEARLADTPYPESMIEEWIELQGENNE